MTGAAAMWHSVEHSGFEGDLPIWTALAEGSTGCVAELGSGTGRVALRLASLGHSTVAVDKDERLLAALRASQAPGTSVRTLCSDVVELETDSLAGCDLVIAPLLLVNTLAADGRLKGFFASLRGACRSGTRFAAAYVTELGRSGENLPASGGFSPAGSGQSHVRSEVDQISFDGDVHTVRWNREARRGSMEAAYERLKELSRSDLEDAGGPHFLGRPDLRIPASGGVIEMKVAVFDAV